MERQILDELKADELQAIKRELQSMNNREKQQKEKTETTNHDKRLSHFLAFFKGIMNCRCRCGPYDCYCDRSYSSIDELANEIRKYEGRRTAPPMTTDDVTCGAVQFRSHHSRRYP